MSYGDSTYASATYAGSAGGSVAVVASNLVFTGYMQMPAVTQKHNVVAQNLVFTTYEQQPVIHQKHNVVASNLVFGSFMTQPILAQGLFASKLVFGSFMQMPTLYQKHNVVASNLVFTTYEQQPAIHQVHHVVAQNLVMDTKFYQEYSGASYVFVNRAGIWRNPRISAKVSGTWKTVTKGWVNYHGVWIPLYFGE